MGKGVVSLNIMNCKECGLSNFKHLQLVGLYTCDVHHKWHAQKITVNTQLHGHTSTF